LIKIFFLVVVVVGALVPAGKLVYRKIVMGGRDVVTTYFAVDYVSAEFKNFYSAQVVNDLRACITKHVREKNILSFQSQNLYAELKSCCKLIKSFDCKIEVPQTVKLTLTGVTPYCVINKHFVLGDKKRLFSVDDFHLFDLNLLPSVVIAKTLPEKIDPHLYTFLHEISQNKWHEFAITYHDARTIELQPHCSKVPCRILVDQQTFFDDVKLHKIGAVFNDMMHRGLLTSKTLQAHEPRLTFDLRFGERVIARCKNSFNRGVGL
jgi:hypothetical protein